MQCFPLVEITEDATKQSFTNAIQLLLFRHHLTTLTMVVNQSERKGNSGRTVVTARPYRTNPFLCSCGLQRNLILFVSTK